MGNRFVRKVGLEILKYGQEITWVLFQYPGAVDYIRETSDHLYDDFESNCNLLFHIERKLGKLGFENTESETWGIPVYTYHSYSAARKGLFNKAFKLIKEVHNGLA